MLLIASFFPSIMRAMQTFPLEHFPAPHPVPHPLCPPPPLHSSLLHCVSCTAYTNCTLRNLPEFQTGGSSAHGKDGRHKTGSRRKTREEQIEVQVQSDLKVGVCWFTFLEGARKHLEAAEMGTQEISPCSPQHPCDAKFRG